VVSNDDKHLLKAPSDDPIQNRIRDRTSCARFRPPAPELAPLVPVAILVGLLPITQGGFGTRNTALIYLFAGDAAPGSWRRWGC